MAYLELNVEQVNKSAELLSYNDHDIDSLSNVVDPRLDISSTSSKKFLGLLEQTSTFLFSLSSLVRLTISKRRRKENIGVEMGKRGGAQPKHKDTSNLVGTTKRKLLEATKWQPSHILLGDSTSSGF